MKTDKQQTARRKGFTAAAIAGVSSFFLFGGAPVLGLVGLAAAGYFTYDWFMFRAKNGMRF